MPDNYTFEIKDKRYFGNLNYGKAQLDADREKFAAEIPIVSKANNKLVDDYLNFVHRNAAWYAVNRKKQEKINGLYIFFSLAIVIAVPVVCYLIPAIGYLEDSETGVITAQVSAILTGGIAFHRMLTSWLFRRNAALDFWRAGTDLKNLHYDLEERWRRSSDDVDAFEVDLQLTLKKARIVVAHETEAHFAAFSNIQVDVGQVLTSAAATSTKLVNDLSQSILEESKKAKAAQAEKKKVVDTVRISLVTARAEARTLQRQLKRKKIRASLHPDADATNELKKEIAAMQFALEARELEQARNEARYKALIEA